MREIRGIYAITDPSLISDQQLYDTVSQAIDGGMSILQYRNKIASERVLQQQAESLKKLCAQNDVLFLINDSVELAHQVDADGVHIGREDGAIQIARKRLGEQAIIGVSCYNQLQNALLAEQYGADYIAFGRFFNSKTKPEAVQAYPELIRQAKQKLQIPIVAIGGITLNNASQLLEEGVDALAIIQGIFAQDNVKEACQALQSLFLSYQS